MPMITSPLRLITVEQNLQFTLPLHMLLFKRVHNETSFLVRLQNEKKEEVMKFVKPIKFWEIMNHETNK